MYLEIQCTDWLKLRLCVSTQRRGYMMAIISSLIIQETSILSLGKHEGLLLRTTMFRLWTEVSTYMYVHLCNLEPWNEDTSITILHLCILEIYHKSVLMSEAFFEIHKHVHQKCPFIEVSSFQCRLYMWGAYPVICPGITEDYELLPIIVYSMYVHTYIQVWRYIHTYHRLQSTTIQASSVLMMRKQSLY